MTYVVNDKCIKCKYMDCVEVCPVDCFYEGENMLVIHPDECIDCGVCEPECPAEAIVPDTEPGHEKWLAKNGIDPAKYAEVEKSFSVATKVQRAKQLTSAYKVDGVPRIVVNGRYYTSPDQAGGADQRMMSAVEAMIALARKEKTAQLSQPAKLVQQ